MAKQQNRRRVESLFAEAFKFEKPGQEISGKYVGSQVVEEGKSGPFTAYHLQLADGKRVSLSGAALDNIMPQIPRGAAITVAYKGMVQAGKNEMKDYDVFLDDDDVQLLDPLSP